MRCRAFTLVILATMGLLVAASAFAQDGTLKVRVTPKTGYVLVDGRPIGQGKQSVRLAAGEHRVQVVRYGRQPFEQSVAIAAGETRTLDVKLEPAGGTVSGPWGRIRLLVSPNRAAVYLNGRTPGFLIGCVGATDHNFLGKQELLVRPGTYQLAIALDGYRTYTGSVAVGENERVEVRLNLASGSGEETIPATTMQRKAESRLAKIGSSERERTAMISMRAAVAPLSAQLAATPTSLRCGDSARLTWSSIETQRVEISGIGEVAASGEQLVTPTQNTTYTLTAAAPGGVETASASVTVDTRIRAAINLSNPSVAIETLDGKETRRGTATLSWNVDNASAVEISGLGAVAASGSRSVAPDQNTVYTLTARNACGTVETARASLGINRVDRHTPQVQLASIFFPTDYPDEGNPALGLLRSQMRIVELVAQGFRDYLKVRSEARLKLEAHADERASLEHNQALARRRGEIIRQRLAAAGIPSANLEVIAYGEEQPLQPEAVAALEQQNPSPAPKPRARDRRGNWLAYNRRVDIILSPTGQSSVRYYPHQVEDADILWRVPKPSLDAIKRASP